MIPNIFQEQPLHVSSCLDIHNMFVQPFESSVTRKNIWKDFKKMINYIEKYHYLHHLDCIYLDGEFISQNANPDALNILLKFDCDSLLTEYGDLNDFIEWQDDLYEVSSVLFKRVELTTTFCNIDSTNPRFQALYDFSEGLTKSLLAEYAKAPGYENRNKIYLILNKFDL